MQSPPPRIFDSNFKLLYINKFFNSLQMNDEYFEDKFRIYLINLFDAMTKSCNSYNYEKDESNKDKILKSKNFIIDYSNTIGNIVNFTKGYEGGEEYLFKNFADQITNHNQCVKNLNLDNLKLHVKMPSVFSGGSMLYKNRKYKIRTGERGGKYILVSNKKVYV